jgi:P pilus assembly chaperone PapD
MLRRGRFVEVALAAAALFAGAFPARAQVAVDELELRFALRSGAAALQTFHVSNESDSAQQVTITSEDWDRDELGKNQFYPLGQLSTSCRKRVVVSPTVFQLAPHSVQTIRVSVDSAATFNAGCYTILFVETPRPPNKTQSAITYAIRYGVKVYAEPATLPDNGEVEDVQVRRDSASADSTVRALSVLFHNTGSRHLLVHGMIEIRRPDNSLVSKVDVPEFPALPAARRRLSVELPKLGAGRYVVLALLDYGGREIVAGQAELQVP